MYFLMFLQGRISLYIFYRVFIIVNVKLVSYSEIPLGFVFFQTYFDVCACIKYQSIPCKPSYPCSPSCPRQPLNPTPVAP